MLYFIIPFEAAALNADNFAVLIFEPQIGTFMKLLADCSALCVRQSPRRKGKCFTFAIKNQVIRLT